MNKLLPVFLLLSFLCAPAYAGDEIEDIAALAQKNAARYLQDADSIKKDSFEMIERVKKDKEFIEAKLIADKQLNALQDNINKIGGKEPRRQILVFVSFSMPEQAIKQFMSEAEAFNASVNIQGLVEDTFPKTVFKLQKLVFDNNGQGGINIDPVVFNKYGVKRVPAIVLKSDNDDFDVVYGRGSIRAALNDFSDDGDVALFAQDILRGANE